MKKILLISILVCLSGIGIHAQKLGFIGGPSLNHGNIWIENEFTKINPLPGAGFHIGGLFEMDITNRWGFDAAIMYEMRSSAFKLNYNNADTTTFFSRQLFYLNVPLHVYVNLPIQNKYIISLFAGPSVGIGLHGQDAAWLLTETKKPVTFQNEEMYGKDKGRVMRFEIAAEVGMAFKYKNYQARVAYQYGFNNSTKNGYQYTFPLSSSTKNYYSQGALRLSFAYVFDLSK